MIKLRIMTQIRIVANSGGWGWFKFNPANLHDPLKHMNATGSTSGNHYSLKVVLKDGVAITPRPQPYGYDHWIGISSSNVYQKWTVLGSSCSLIKTSDHIVSDSGSRHYAGWSKLMAETDDFGTPFQTMYDNIDSSEVADWLNTGIVRKPAIITASKVFDKPEPAFTFNYSQRKYKAQLKKKGIDDGDWYGEHASPPVVNPEAFFMLADLGLPSVATDVFPFMFVCDYTVQLSGLIMGGEDVV